MSLKVIAVVLFAALLYAGWHILVKRSEDSWQSMCMVANSLAIVSTVTDVVPLRLGG